MRASSSICSNFSGAQLQICPVVVPGGRREGGHVADAPGLAVLPCRELVDDDAQEVLTQRAEARMLGLLPLRRSTKQIK